MTTFAICIATALVGCGDEEMTLYPVSGKVTFQGKPAANALVVFHDKRPAEAIHDVPIPRGRTDKEGRFQLSCHQPGDGAPAGEYVVTVMLSSVTAAGIARAANPDPAVPGTDGADIDPESASAAPPTEGLQYLDPETSGLEAVVLEQANVLPPFALK